MTAPRDTPSHADVPLIDRTYNVRKPNGAVATVNVLEMNVALVCDSYVQLTDGSWISSRLLEVEPKTGGGVHSLGTYESNPEGPR